MSHAFLGSSWLRNTVIIVVIVCIGAIVRLAQLQAWEDNPTRAFYNEEPNLSAFDAYYYASVAQDLINEEYGAINEKRRVPDSPARAQYPPLLSLLTAKLSKLSGLSVNWVAIYLPPILAALIAIPLFLIGAHWGGTTLGTLTAVFGSLPITYLQRTSIGRLDTDCLIVFFPLMTLYLFLLFGSQTNMRRYLHLVLGLSFVVLFCWWWDQAPVLAALLATPPLLAVIIFDFHSTNKLERTLIFSVTGLLLSGFVVWTMLDSKNLILTELKNRYLYVSGFQSTYFPNMSDFIGEQRSGSLLYIANATTGHLVTFFTAIGGLLLFFYQHPRSIPIFSVFIVLTLLAVLFANRFLIFACPLLALGGAHLIHFAWNRQGESSANFKFVATSLAAVFLWSYVQIIVGKPRFPVFSEKSIEGFHKVAELTEPDALIWAWWENGYALQFVSDRATISDGQYHSGELTTYNALPFSSGNSTLSANFIIFYSEHGKGGMDRIYSEFDQNIDAALRFVSDVLGAGREASTKVIQDYELISDHFSLKDWVTFLFPVPKRAIYLFLNSHTVRSAAWIHIFGDLNGALNPGHPPRLTFFSGLRKEGNNIVGAGDVWINLRRKELHIGEEVTELQNVVYNSAALDQLQDTAEIDGLTLEINLRNGHGLLTEEKIRHSLLNKMLIQPHEPITRFKPIVTNGLLYQLWKLEPDSRLQ